MSQIQEPNAVELENAIIGAVISQQGAISDCLQFIKKPEVFYDATNRMLFGAVIHLYENSQPIDNSTVAQHLNRTSKTSPNGNNWMYEALTITDHAVRELKHLQGNMLVLVEMHTRRELYKLMQRKSNALLDTSIDMFKELEGYEENYRDLVDGNSRGAIRSAKELLTESLEQMASAPASGLTGIPSGFGTIDRETAGFQRSNLIIIAARPGMGKTAFVGSMMENAAINHNVSIGVFSMEMSGVQIMNRLVSSVSNVPLEAIKKHDLGNGRLQEIINKTDKLAKAPIYIDDTPALTVLEMKSKARRMKNLYGIDMLIVDYLQLGEAKANNREQEVSKLSAAMKAIAKELDIPVIALSQLSRAVESRGGDKKPMLSDLRDSGSIEQDADIVLFLYRAEYYGFEQDENGMPTKGMGEVIFAKNRDGNLGTETMRFDGAHTRWQDLKTDYSEPENQSNEGQIETSEAAW